MTTYKEGDVVTVTFKGIVNRQGESGSLSVQRNHSGTYSYFEASELPHVSVIVHKKPFTPKSGEVYLLRAAGGRGEWTTWFCMQRNYTRDPSMVSPAGIFSLQTFKDAYDNDSWEIVRANVSPASK